MRYFVRVAKQLLTALEKDEAELRAEVKRIAQDILDVCQDEGEEIN